MDKPIKLDALSEEKADEVSSKARDSGSMLDDRKGLAKLTPAKRVVEDTEVPMTNGPNAEAIRKLYMDYKRNVIGNKEPTDEQIRVLKGIADRLLDEDQGG